MIPEMSRLPQWAYFLILAFLLFLSMVFSSGETAFLSVNKLKIKYLREKKNKKAVRVEKILQNKHRFLTTSLIGNSLVNILISVILTALTVRFAGSAGLGIAVGAATVAILIFGEIIPKSAALVFSEPIALRFSAFILFLMRLLTPAVWLLSGFTGLLLKLGGIHNLNAGEALTDADLKDFFDSSQEGGALHSDERNVLEKILNYGDITVKNIMTPRPDITAIQVDAAPMEIIELSHESRFSRFPVYGKDIDDIKGVLYIKDFLFSEDSNSGILKQPKQNFDIKKYMRKPVPVFENTELSKLQEIFKTEKQNMVVVIDEYGGTLGYDTDEAAADELNLQNVSEDSGDTFSFTVSGNTRLTDLNGDLGTSFSSEYYDTVGGLIMERCGEVPKVNTSIKIENYTFTVKKTEGNRITELEIVLSGEDE